MRIIKIGTMHTLKYNWIGLLLVVILLNPFIGTAQNDGTLDTSFGNGGRVITDLPNFVINAYTETDILQNDGKIISVESGKEGNNLQVIKVMRYLPDGSMDMNWGQNGTVTTSIPGGNDILTVYDAKEQPDGKILIGGIMDTLIGSNSSIVIGFLARYLENGVIDTSFGENGFIYQFSLPSNSDYPNIIYQLVIQQNRIITISIDSYYSTRLEAYLISNGVIDTSWGNNGIQVYDFSPLNNFTTGIVDVKIQDDGKFLISSKDLIFRFLPSGDLDSSFADDGHLTPLYASMNSQGFTYLDQPLRAALTVDLLPDQRILVSGTAPYYSQYGGLGIVECYMPNGTLDSTFSNTGICLVNYNTSNNQKYKQAMGRIATQNDGSFIVAGNVRDTSASGNGKFMFAMEKFSKEGTPNMNFGNDGVVISSPFISSNPIDWLTNIIIQPDSKILLFGTNWDSTYTVNSPLLISRYNNTDATTGFEENHLTEKNFEMYPNPAGNQLTVRVPQEGEIKIYNTMGQCVLKQKIKEGNQLVPLERLNKGVYFVNYVISPAQYYYKKLIKY